MWFFFFFFFFLNAGIDLYNIQDKIDSGQLKSAKDLENFISAVQTSGNDPVEEKLVDHNLLNLMRVQKSTSLDSKLVGQRQTNLKVNQAHLIYCNKYLLNIENTTIYHTPKN